MTDEPSHFEHEVDAVTAEEAAAGMTDDQLLAAWEAVSDRNNLTDLEEAVAAQMKQRALES